MADTKLSDIANVVTTPSTGAILYIVEDPTGTPASGKITTANLLASRLLTNGTVSGATSQAQTFTNGIVGPAWKPASNSTTAIQIQNAAGSAVVTVDTTNKYFGVGTTPSYPFHANHTSTTATTEFSNAFLASYTPSSPAAVSKQTLYVYNSLYGTHSIGALRAITFQANNYNTGTLTDGYAFDGLFQNRAAGTVENAYGINVAVNNLGAGGITTAYGVNISSPGNSGGGSITTTYGLYVRNQTTGTNNYAIFTNTGDIRLMSSSSDKLGLHGATPVAKQTVTGSRGGNAALADLLTKLANVGLITNSTSA